VSALPVLIVLFSGSMKVMKPAPVVQGFAPARRDFDDRLSRRCDGYQRARRRSIICCYGDSWDPGLVRTLFARSKAARIRSTEKLNENSSRLTALLHVTASFRELSDKKLLSQARTNAFSSADCKIAEHESRTAIRLRVVQVRDG